MAPSSSELKTLLKWRRSTFWVLLIGYIGYYLCRGNISAALPLLSSQFGYSNSQLAIILTFSELVYALGKFINGPLADKLGGKRIFLLGMLGAVAFNLLFIQFSSILMFTITWSLCRFFLSMGWGGVLKMVGAWYEPEKNGTVMGLISINFQLGGAFALLYCSLILYLGMDWKALFYIPAATLAVILVWSAFASKESPQDVIPGVDFAQSREGKTSLLTFESHGVDGKPKVRDIVKTLFKLPMFRHLLWFSFLCTFLRSIFIFWTAKFLSDIGLSDAGAILKSAVFPCLGILGSIFLGWYTDHYTQGNRAGVMWLTLLGLVFSLFGIGMLVPYSSEYQSWIVALTGACGFFLIGPYSMISGCLTLDIAGPEGSGTCTGLFDGVGYLGGSLAVWGAGVLSDKLGWSQVFYLLSAFSVLAVISAYHMSQMNKKNQKQSELSHDFSSSIPSPLEV